MAQDQTLNIEDLPEKWRPFAQSALAQTPESLIGINPDVLHGATLALLADLAETAEGRTYWRNTTIGKSETIGSLLEEVARLQTALSESLKLQTRYAKLLNAWDGGERRHDFTLETWIERLKETGKI